MKISEGSIFLRTVDSLNPAGRISQLYQSLSARFDEFQAGSKLITGISVIGSWGRKSGIAGGFETFKRYFKGSFIFQWLTKEPDPEVIVIDLRETITIAPILILIEWIADWIGAATNTSVVFRKVGAIMERLGPMVANSKFVALLIELLEPPENELDRPK